MVVVSTLTRARLVLAMLALAVTCLAAPAAAAAAPSTTTAAQRAAAAVAAQAEVGSPYRRGSVGPRSFDCSGLVVASYRQAGVSLLARTSQEMWKRGARVTRARLQPGDLVYTWDRSLGHVGLYLGRGRYVHAPGRGRRVEVAPLPSGRGFIGAVRP